jgi:hypothetical protein
MGGVHGGEDFLREVLEGGGDALVADLTHALAEQVLQVKEGAEARDGDGVDHGLDRLHQHLAGLDDELVDGRVEQLLQQTQQHVAHEQLGVVDVLREDGLRVNDQSHAWVLGDQLPEGVHGAVEESLCTTQDTNTLTPDTPKCR